jgi:hypothetical protein
MALIARLQHPYIVEFKEAWVEKVFHLKLHLTLLFGFEVSVLNIFIDKESYAGLLCLHHHWLL